MTSASRPHATGIALLIVAASLWSLSGVALKVLHPPSPIALVFWRSVGAMGLMAALLPWAKGRWPHPGWMALAMVLYAGTVALLIESMAAGTAAQGIALQYTSPMWTALLGWSLLRRRLSGPTMVAVALVSAGVGLMIAGAFVGASTSAYALATGIGSGLCFGALVLALERVDRARRGTAAVKIVLCLNLGAIAVAGPLYMGSTGAPITPGVVAWLIALGVVQLGLPYLLFQHALRRVSPVEASLISVLEPVLNPIWVWWAVGEQPGRWVMAGGACIFAAMIVEALKPVAAIEQEAPERSDEADLTAR